MIRRKTDKKLMAACAAAALMLSGCGNAIEPNNGAPVTVGSDEAQPEVVTAAAETETATTTTTTTVTTTTTPMVTTSAAPEEETYEYMDGCIVAYSGTPQVRAMESYYYDEETGRYLAERVDAYADSVGDDVNTWLMMIPNAQEFYLPSELKEEYSDQKESADDVYSMLNSAEGVPINSILEEHKAEYIYSRSDYHWQPLAAFYASKVFTELAEVDFADFKSYEEVEREGYLGAFYSVNGIWPLEEYPDTFTYYKPENLDDLTVTFHDTYFGEGFEGDLFFEDLDISASYTVFVGTDDTILEIDTDVDNDRVLVIFKDSYGNALVPFLTSSFSKIYLCDNRFFNINSVDFAQEVGATDVLFALGPASSGSYDKISLIEENMYNY